MTSMDWSAQVGDGPSEYQQFLVPGMFAPFAARLVADLEITPGLAMLDVACGTGVVTRLAARAAGPTGTVTGVDIGPAMLAVARSQPTESGSAPITYLEGSALELPLADSSFDCATCHHGFQFFPDRVAAIRELRRVLRPGGRVAIACRHGSCVRHKRTDETRKHGGRESAPALRLQVASGPRQNECRRRRPVAGDHIC